MIAEGKDVVLRITVVVCGILLGLLTALIVKASLQESVIAGLVALLANPWGVVTLVDLIIGLLFVAAWLAVVETHPGRAALWIAALCLLGNVVTLIFLLCRTRHAQRFSDLWLPNRRSGR